LTLDLPFELDLLVIYSHTGSNAQVGGLLKSGPKTQQTDTCRCGVSCDTDPT